jgi:DNA-binding XRE family transcriptional regulator
MRNTYAAMLIIGQHQSLAPARKGAGLTVAELSRRSGVSRDTIERIEAGKFGGRIETWHKLAAALDPQEQAA